MTDWFGVEPFIPHGFCLSWDPDIMIMTVVSNSLIALAFMIITGILAGAALAPRPAVPRWVYWSFAGFIFCCAVSHVMDNVTLWWPLYRLQALILGLTACVSMLAALFPLSIWLTSEVDRWRR